MDLEELLNDSDDGLVMLNLFLWVICCIAFSIGTFLLIISTSQKIRNNLKEIGILLSLGLSRSQLETAFLYESLTVIISSSLIGVFIGIMVATTLTIQFLMFAQFPFSFQGPWVELGVTFCLNIVMCYLVNRRLMRRIRTKSITCILSESVY